MVLNLQESHLLLEHWLPIMIRFMLKSIHVSMLNLKLNLTKNSLKMPIAIGQMHLENEQLKIADKLLICDTDLLETKVYSEFYYDGFCPDILKKYALENAYDLYFLTYIDTPWEADGIRDQPNTRLQMFTAFEQELIDSKKRYSIVKGSFEQRLNLCITQINELLNIVN